jgi:hypothetical protein
MSHGPGKYDEAATLARNMTHARAVVLIVLGGTAGSGFSVQALGEDITASLPALLRTVAYQIENDLKEQP